MLDENRPVLIITPKGVFANVETDEEDDEDSENEYETSAKKGSKGEEVQEETETQCVVFIDFESRDDMGDIEYLTCKVPISVGPGGESFVELQSVLNFLPLATSFRRLDSTPIRFLTNEDDILLVPLRIPWFPDEIIAAFPQSTADSVYEDAQDSDGQEELDEFADARSTQSEIRAPPEAKSDFVAYSEMAPELPERDPPLTKEDLKGFLSNFQSESPLPGLFILLPDAESPARPGSNSSRTTASIRPGLSSSSSSSTLYPSPCQQQSGAHQVYRLYFLCECGEGLTFARKPLQSSSGNKQRQQQQQQQQQHDNCIHIADQMGIKVHNLTRFVELFGRRALRCLKLLYRGANAEWPTDKSQKIKIAVPPLAQQHYSDVLQPFTWDIEERVTTAIQVLESMLTFIKPKCTADSLDAYRLWECVEGSSPGEEDYTRSMYRVVNNDGICRWVCDAHYQSSFGALDEDRSLALWQFKEILGDPTGVDVVGDDSDHDFAATCLNPLAVSTELPSVQPRPVTIEDRTKRLRVHGLFSPGRIQQLRELLTRGFVVQEMTLTLPLTCSGERAGSNYTQECLEALKDLVLGAPVIINLQLRPDAGDTNQMTRGQQTFGGPTSILPVYSFESSDFSLPTGSSVQKRRPLITEEVGSVHGLFLLGRIRSLEVPDLNGNLLKDFSPSENEFSHLKRLHLWASTASGDLDFESTRRALRAPEPTKLLSLLRACPSLTRLSLSGIFLGDPPNPVSSTDARIHDVTRSLNHLKHLSVLELSSCGLLEKHCVSLARSLGQMENPINSLDIHNNWIQDDGLAELIWSVGSYLCKLDARNCGFGDACAFALYSTLQAQEKDHRIQGAERLSNRTTLFKVLLLQETCNPHTQLWEPTELTRSFAPARDLGSKGREDLVRAIGLMEPVELQLSFKLGFQDDDFASALVGMKGIDGLECLEVSYSNFGPRALEAMLRMLRLTSCRIRRLGLHSTKLSAWEERQARDSVLSI